jgi:hypothetical protein
MASFTTLNPADKVNITLSGGNLTFAQAGSNAGARAITPQTTGKFYFEVAWTTATGNDTGCGLAKLTANFGSLQSNAALGVITYHGFGIFVNGSSTGINPGAITAGHTTGVAVDLGGSLIWFTTDGTHWNSTSSTTNNPATGVGGVSISGITGGALYPVVIAQGAGDGGTCNFGDSAFAYSVPSGFAGWPVPVPQPQIANRTQQRITLRIAPSWADDQLAQEWTPALRLRNFHTTWKINAKQIEVAKFLNYPVLSAPDAADVAKFVQYDVLAAPDAADVAKFVNYTVLEFSPVPQLPARSNLVQRLAPEWEEIDNWQRQRPIIGMVSKNAFPPITGLEAAALSGIFPLTTNLVGLEATAELGPVIPDVEPPITGVEADTAIGTLGFSSSATFLGQHATAQSGNLIGTVGPNTGQSTLTGVQANTQQGRLGFTQTLQISAGVQANTAVGTLAVNISTGGLMMTSMETETIPGFGPPAFVSMRYSDTKGASWRFPVRQPLGNPGSYATNVQFRQNGIARDRIYDVSWGTAQATALTGLMVELEESAT